MSTSFLTQTTNKPAFAPLAEACLNAINFGVLLVDSAGGILFINNVATDMIRRGGGACTWLPADHIDSIKVPLLRQRLKDLIVQSESNPVSSKYSSAHLEINMVACSARNAGVVVFLYHSDFEPSDQFCRRTQKLYELTSREAQIAYELIIGKTVDAIAERLGVQKNTVRMHLKRIYEKTGTHCQSQLVSRLMGNLFLMGH